MTGLLLPVFYGVREREVSAGALSSMRAPAAYPLR
jgi:hypothetical protein